MFGGKGMKPNLRFGGKGKGTFSAESGHVQHRGHVEIFSFHELEDDKTWNRSYEEYCDKSYKKRLLLTACTEEYNIIIIALSLPLRGCLS